MNEQAFLIFALIWLLSCLVVLLIGSMSARRKIKPMHDVFINPNQWEDLK